MKNAGAGRVGRKKKFGEQAIVRLPDGTKDRIQDVLGPVEDMADLIRSAIERELQRREESKKITKRPK
jgi:hypothetical protein